MEIRDPLHGSIPLEDREIRIADHPLVQRLRNIRQLGYASISYPGATHTRYLHSLGAMHLAGRAFDAVVANSEMAPPAAEQERLRALVRLAALLHDVGHPPLSHTTESALPPVGTLGIEGYDRPHDAQASHEDLTIALVLSDELGGLIDEMYADLALDRRLVASIVSPQVHIDRAALRVGGADTHVLLHQLVSSELDVDRMDYLVRDAYFAGVRYGMFDRSWLISGLTAVRQEDRWHLGLDQRALMAFEDFLLSRYHMFLAVYFHHRTIGFDYMLKRWFDGAREEFEVPTTPDEFARFDDHALAMLLRQSENAWAQRIVRRNAPHRILELHGDDDQRLRPDLDERLANEGIEGFWVSSESTVSKYHHKVKSGAPYTHLFIRRPPAPGRPSVVPLHDSTDLFRKYDVGYRLHRLYTKREDSKRARAALR